MAGSLDAEYERDDDFESGTNLVTWTIRVPPAANIFKWSGWTNGDGSFSDVDSLQGHCNGCARKMHAKQYKQATSSDTHGKSHKLLETTTGQGAVVQLNCCMRSGNTT